MNFKYCVGLGIHLFMLLTCLTTTVLMTLVKALVNHYEVDVYNKSFVSISDFNIQPDMPVAAHVLLIALGLFVPSVTGLFWTCFKRGPRKKVKALKLRIRTVHLVFGVIGVVAVCVLIFPQASSFTDVKCWLDNNNCKCGNSVDTSNSVCACRELRISYFTFLICGFLQLLLSIGVVAKLIPVRWPCGSAQVGQDAGGTTENTANTANTTVPSMPPLSSQHQPTTANRQDGDDQSH